jgi:hypothetical protein
MITRILLILVATVALCGCGSPAPAAVLVQSNSGTYALKTTLAAAATAADCAGKTIIITTDQTLTGNLTWPADRELIPMNGAKIIHGAYTFTYYGSTARWPLAQMLSGTGTVTILGDTRPEWWKTNDGIVDMTAAVQSAIDATWLGCSVLFGPLPYVVSGTGDSCLTLTRNVNLKGLGYRGSSIRADITAGNTTTNIVNVEVTANGAYTDVRNMRIEGINFWFTAGGKSSIEAIDGPSPLLPQHKFTVTDCGLMGVGGYAISIQGGFNFSEVSRCQIDGGIYYPFISDGQKVYDNVFFGNNVGVWMYADFGTYSHVIQNNSFNCRDGAVWIQNGSQIKIRDNQMEQSGVNASTWSAMVTIIGGAYQSRSIDITGNNFGGGSNYDYSVAIFNAHSTVIRDNEFQTPATSDIYIYDSTGDSTVIGYNRGLTAISDGGAGSYGTTKDSTHVTFTNSWAAGVGFSFIKSENRVVSFTGSATTGTLTAGTAIMTIPAGFRPRADSYHTLATGTGSVRVLVTAATGVVTIFHAAAPDATIHLGNLSYLSL